MNVFDVSWTVVRHQKQRDDEDKNFFFYCDGCRKNTYWDQHFLLIWHLLFPIYQTKLNTIAFWRFVCTAYVKKLIQELSIQKKHFIFLIQNENKNWYVRDNSLLNSDVLLWTIRRIFIEICCCRKWPWQKRFISKIMLISSFHCQRSLWFVCEKCLINSMLQSVRGRGGGGIGTPLSQAIEY